MHKHPTPEPKTQTPPPKPKKIRDAGPDAMQDPPKKWTETDQTSDESFPASDPPGKY